MTTNQNSVEESQKLLLWFIEWQYKTINDAGDASLKSITNSFLKFSEQNEKEYNPEALLNNL